MNLHGVFLSQWHNPANECNLAFAGYSRAKEGAWVADGEGHISGLLYVYPSADKGIVVEQLTTIWRAFIHFHLIPRMPQPNRFIMILMFLHHIHTNIYIYSH